MAVALDGAICVLMALPLALPLALAGAYVGWLARRGTSRPPRTYALALVALPLAMGAEAEVDRPPAQHAVTTSVVVDAPPETVWRRVVAFPPLPEPRSLHFRAGIAYPRSATISGRGVGAVRRCRFSTGDFVEPITVWDEPRRLAFSVTEQPAPMRELSFWGRCTRRTSTASCGRAGASSGSSRSPAAGPCCAARPGTRTACGPPATGGSGPTRSSARSTSACSLTSPGGRRRTMGVT